MRSCGLPPDLSMKPEKVTPVVGVASVSPSRGELMQPASSVAGTRIKRELFANVVVDVVIGAARSQQSACRRALLRGPTRNNDVSRGRALGGVSHRSWNKEPCHSWRASSGIDHAICGRRPRSRGWRHPRKLHRGFESRAARDAKCPYRDSWYGNENGPLRGGDTVSAAPS